MQFLSLIRLPNVNAFLVYNGVKVKKGQNHPVIEAGNHQELLIQLNTLPKSRSLHGKT